VVLNTPRTIPVNVTFVPDTPRITVYSPLCVPPRITPPIVVDAPLPNEMVPVVPGVVAPRLAGI